MRRCTSCQFDLRLISIDRVPGHDDQDRVVVVVSPDVYHLKDGIIEPTQRFVRSVERDRERWRQHHLTDHELLVQRTLPKRKGHDRAQTRMEVPLPTSIICALCGAKNSLQLPAA